MVIEDGHNMESLFPEMNLLSPGEGKVIFDGTEASIRVPKGTYLIDAAREAGLEVPQQCGGMAICLWCRMEVLEGEAYLSKHSNGEKRLVEWGKLNERERASCQAQVLGNVTVTAQYW